MGIVNELCSSCAFEKCTISTGGSEWSTGDIVRWSKTHKYPFSASFSRATNSPDSYLIKR